MTEIYEIFQIYNVVITIENFSDNILNILDILCNILGIITIIPISIVFVAIRKRSNNLYALFYIASLIEVVIILYRLWIFCADYFFYEVFILNIVHKEGNYNF
jgi:RNAse (barnase) inhibitor barstar